MWWTQCFLFISILANLQNAQSESLDVDGNLRAGLKERVDETFSDCDRKRNDEDSKREWNELVDGVASKIIDSLEQMIPKEKTQLPNLSETEAAIEYFKRVGTLEAFEKDLAVVNSELNAFCSEKTGPIIAPRVLPLVILGVNTVAVLEGVASIVEGISEKNK